jgi:methionyl-tRNA synthetase
VGCEQFFTHGELDAGRCPEHGTEPEVVEEDNWFFRLSNYQEQLRELIASDALQITPVERKNEVLRFVERGLEDFSISRSRERARGWGISVPDDPEQVVYVWFDALGNYLAALGYAEESELFARYWLEGSAREHVIGKGITRFHAVYWPAILLSAGLPPPTRVLVHGYVTVDAAAAFDLRAALDAVWRLIAVTNRYADVTAPWKRERDDAVLYTLLDAAGAAGALLAPFLPHTAERIAGQLGARRTGASARLGELSSGTRVATGEVLFPRRA